MAKQLLHVKALVKKVDDQEEGMITGVVGSTAVIDRVGDTINQDGWVLNNYKKNPVVLWGHNVRDDRPPIGKAVKVWFDGVRKKKLMFDIKFDLQDTFAADIYRKVKEGFVNAVSVGFQPLEWQDNEFLSMDLLELSFVPVPANPDALVGLRGLNPVNDIKELYKPKELADFEGLKIVENKSVLPFKDLGIAPISEGWDGPGEVKKAEVSDLKLMSAWVDSESADTKSAYKLPHHKAVGHKAVWRGVAAAMAALLGGRGGVDIPDSDRRGVYNHLVKHYKQFDREAPEFRLIETQVLKGLDEEIAALILEREDKHAIRLLKQVIILLKEQRNNLKRKEQRVTEPTEDDVTDALKVLDIALSKAKEKS